MPGDVGELLPCDFKKYDYLVQLPGTMTIELDRIITAPRQYYFYAGEIEIIESQNDAEPHNKRNH